MLDVSNKIGELLLQKGLIQESDLRKALQIQQKAGGRLGSVLIRVGALSEDALLPVLAQQLELERLTGDALPDDLAVYQCVLESPINLDWFIDHKLVLWPLSENRYGCLAVDILDCFLRDVLDQFYGAGHIEYFLANQQVVEGYLDFVRREHAVDDLFQGAEGSRTLSELAEEAPIIEFVNNIMSQASRRRCRHPGHRGRQRIGQNDRHRPGHRQTLPRCLIFFVRTLRCHRRS